VSSAAKHALREVLVWGAAALGIFGLIYYFDDLRTALGPGAESVSQSAETSARPKGEDKDAGGFGRTTRLKADARGHFVFDASINDRPVTLTADTGRPSWSSLMRMPSDLASPRAASICPLGSRANGVSYVAPVILETACASKTSPCAMSLPPSPSGARCRPTSSA
jgi:aspartyl protease family protein